MISLLRPQHSVAACVCGHGTHVQRGFEKPYVACEACEAIEHRDGVVLTFLRITNVEHMGLSEGQPVTSGRVAFRIAYIEPITKLDRRVETGYCRVALRRIA